MTRVGIGVPVLNGERFLAQALDSLLAQTHEDLHILIGDNASTDRTREIGQDYATRDRRVQYIRRERNVGAAANFTALFRSAGTEFFRWHAADDLVAPEHTGRCLEALQREPRAVLAYSRTQLIDGDGIRTKVDPEDLNAIEDEARDRFFHVHHNCHLCNPVYGLMRTAVAGRSQLLRPHVSSDFALLHELALYGKFVEVPELLFFRRIHPGDTSVLSQPEKQFFFSADPHEKPGLMWWNFFATMERAIWRAPLSVREKGVLQVDLVTKAASKWYRPHLVREAGEYGQFLLRRSVWRQRRATGTAASRPRGSPQEPTVEPPPALGR